MATTMYYEEKLSGLTHSATADPKQRGRIVEIYISSYSREHHIYLKHTDELGKETFSIFTKKQALELRDAMDRAVGYLGYDQEKA